MELEFSISHYDDYTLLYLKGQFIGKEANAFLEEVENTLTQTPVKHLVIDLSSLDYIGSQGAAVLISLSTQYPIILVGISPKIKNALQLLKLDQMFKIYPTLEDVVRYLNTSQGNK